MQRTRLAGLLVAVAAFLPLGGGSSPAEEPRPAPLVVVVMDPLSAPLSCPCVAGYAQRDYEQLGKFLSEELGRPVQVHFGESLTNTLQKKSGGKADLIIGKSSVVLHEAKANRLTVQPLADLSGKDGKTTQTGLIVVAAKDPALSVDDLQGYRIFFGPADCEEKHGAALALLQAHEVKLPRKLETCIACTEGATTVLKLHGEGVKVATVISSYAQPLLEGCGTIEKGDLRVVGETEPVPFIRAFVNDQLAPSDRAALAAALAKVGKNPTLCEKLETKHGFVIEQPIKKN